MNLLTRIGLSAPVFPAPTRILVVAESDTARVVRKILQQARATVEVVADCATAEIRSESVRYDVVIIDLTLAGGACSVRDIRRKFDVAVVGLVDCESDGIKALMRGADGVFNLRTLQATELIGSIERIIAGHRPNFSVMQLVAETQKQASRTLNNLNSAWSGLHAK